MTLYVLKHLEVFRFMLLTKILESKVQCMYKYIYTYIDQDSC